MKGLLLTKPSRAKQSEYFNMIGDSLIVPSTRSLKLDEWYFRDIATEIVNNPNTKANAKKLLREKSSGVYFEPLWEETLSINNLINRVDDSVKLAMESLGKAKQYRQGAIDSLGKLVQVSMKTARERVDESIARDKLNVNLKNQTTKQNVVESIDAMKRYVYYWTIADAYTAEIERRSTNEILVNNAISKDDVKELKALRSKVTVKELQTRIDDAIKDINDAIAKAEAEAKAQADSDNAKRKAEEDARIKLSQATTAEEKAQAQAELDALLKKGSNGSGIMGNKTLLYVGIGAVVLLSAFFILRKKD